MKVITFGHETPFGGIWDEDSDAPPGSLDALSVNVIHKNGRSVFDLPVSEPANQPTSFVYSNLVDNGTISVDLSWTAAAGGADAYLVIMKQDSAPTGTPNDNQVYNAGDTLGNGTVIKSGAGVSVSLSGLVAGSTYHFRAFSYNGFGINRDYKAGSPLTGSKLMVEDEPANQPTSLVFSNVNTTSMTLSFTAAVGSPDGYIAIRRAGAAPTGTPSDGQNYSVGNTIGDGTVAFIGSGVTFNDTGLTADVTYHYAIFSYNGSAYKNFKTGSPLTGNETPTFFAFALSFNGVDDFCSCSEIDLNNVFSVEQWVSFSINQDHLLWSRDSTSNGLTANQSGSDMVLTLRDFPTGNSTTKNIGVPSTGSKYHIVVTRNGSAVKFYVNGVDQSPNTSDAISSTEDCRIQRIGRRTSGTFLFKGKIAKMRTYSSVLSASEITALYNSGSGADPAANCTHDWKFNEGTGGIVADSVGLNDFTLGFGAEPSWTGVFP